MSKNIQSAQKTITSEVIGSLVDKKLSRKRVGAIGESAAVAYLKHKGHEILGRNIRLRRGEIDILTKKDTTLHVVEVKTSVVPIREGQGDGASGSLILPEEKFSKQKIGRLKYLANVILAKYSGMGGEQGVQIDGIAIRLYQDSGKQGSVSNLRESATKITAKFYEAIA